MRKAIAMIGIILLITVSISCFADTKEKESDLKPITLSQEKACESNIVTLRAEVVRLKNLLDAVMVKCGCKETEQGVACPEK